MTLLELLSVLILIVDAKNMKHWWLALIIIPIAADLVALTTLEDIINSSQEAR